MKSTPQKPPRTRQCAKPLMSNVFGKTHNTLGRLKPLQSARNCSREPARSDSAPCLLLPVTAPLGFHPNQARTKRQSTPKAMSLFP